MHGPTRERARFESFRVDLTTGELFRSGVRISVQDQPFQLLRLLLEASGKPVSRELIRQTLWPADTFVDFEHAVNTAVRKLRHALEDSAEQPRFIETLPKIGYRFIAPIEWEPDEDRRAALSAAGVPLRADRPWRSWPLALALAGALVLAALAAYVVRVRSQPPAEALRVLPFTTFPGFEIAPSFSPDGNNIVFSWFGYEREYNFDLYVKQVGQERVLQLTHHPAIFLGSSWSPDGRLIAFMRQAEPDATGIYVISPLGGAERKLASFPAMEDFGPLGVTWTPDSRRVAFSKVVETARIDERGASRRIHVVNIETSEEHVLPSPASECVDVWQPAFSPDGKTLASECVLTGGVAKVYLQDADGGNSRELAGAPPSESVAGIAWMPDSQAIVYSADGHLWRIPLGGASRERLLFAQDAESVSIARTGNRLAYVQTRHPPAIYRFDLADATTAASAATRFISSSRGDALPGFAPDGQAVVFVSERSGSPEIWQCDRDGENPVQLSHFDGPNVGPPQWSPDGQRIAFHVRFPGKPQVYVVNRTGGPPKRFETGTPNAMFPTWSSDGHYIYFSTERPNAVWKIPADGGAPIRLTTDGGVGSLESDDHRRVMYQNEQDGLRLWSVSIDGGDERPVPDLPREAWSWTLAPHGFYYLTGSPQQRQFAMMHFDTTSRQSTKVADLRSLFHVSGLTVSKDGRTVLFNGNDHSEGDIMLVEGWR